MNRKKKNVFLVSYGGGHAAMIIPVIRELQKNSSIKCYTLALTTAQKIFDREKIDYIGFKDLIENTDQDAISVGRTLIGINAHPDISETESIAYLGLSFWDLCEREGGEKAKQLYSSLGRRAFLPLSILRRAFTRFAPDLLVTTNCPRSELAALMVAQELGIPSISVIDLFGLDFSREWTMVPGYATKVCVFSDAVKKAFVDAGVPEEEVKVTGNPAFDCLADGQINKDAKRLRMTRGWLGRKVVVWAAQAPGADSRPLRDIESKLIEVGRESSDIKIVFRFHPSEVRLPDNIPSFVHVSTQDENLAVLLMAADIVVTTVSTVGIQAALLNKPLIALSTAAPTYEAPYAEMGLAIGLSNNNKLPETIRAILYEGQYFRPNTNLPKPGDAAKNIANLVYELLDKECRVAKDHDGE